MVSSLGGSAFQAFCPPAIANSVIGVTAFSAVMGGAGAYLGGARSSEEILMGVVAGAMTGALNHGLGEMREKAIAIAQAKLKQAELLARLYVHYQFGGGPNSPIVIPASDIDFSDTSQKELGLSGMKPGTHREVSLFKAGTFNGNALAFGRVTMTYVGDNKFTFGDTFNFDYDDGASFWRNAGTFLGGSIFGRFFDTMTPLTYLTPNAYFGGPGFKIIINGSVTIPK